MSLRSFVPTALLAVGLVSASASVATAQGAADGQSALVPAAVVQTAAEPMTMLALAQAAAGPVALDVQARPLPMPQAAWADARPRTSSNWLLPMHAATIALQALDAHSTFRVLDAPGGYEANPIMSKLVQNRAAFIGLKAGAAAGLIYATHNTSKHSRVRAVLTAAAVNTAYAMIVAHNYRNHRQLTAR
jgi:hypothetical protein